MKQTNRRQPIHNGAGRVAILFLAMLLAAHPVSGADKKNRDREMLRRVQVQLQQAEGEKAALAEEKARLGTDLEGAKKEAATAKRKLRSVGASLTREKSKNEALSKDLATLQEEAAGLKEKLAQTETSLADTSRKLADTSNSLARTESERKHLEGIKGRQEKEIARCDEHNHKLYEAGRDILKQWQQAAIKASDPVLGLKRVEIENLGESFRDRLDEEKIVKAPER